MNISFEGKVALVTGAASGLGFATAKAFAESGASVALADWNEDAVHAAAEEPTAQGHEAIAIRCNVADDAQVEAMVKRTVAPFGRLMSPITMLASRMSSPRPPTPPVRITTASWGSTSAANGAA
jgi:NAD(P)-dependent dehydrogenase (short-subunit alcohol dehydrogenase family)